MSALPIPPSHPNPTSGLLANLMRSPIFGACTRPQLEPLASSASIHRERRGFKIADRDASFPYLGFVCEGVIGVTARADGPMRGVRRFLLYEALPGSTFGEVPFWIAPAHSGRYRSFPSVRRTL